MFQRPDHQPKNNYAATAPPTIHDDASQGYAAASRWLDTTNRIEYVCVDATTGAAIWLQISASRVPRNGLIAEYTMDSIIGTTLYDTSGNGYHGTINGTLTSVAGKVGNALSSGGHTNYVLLPNAMGVMTSQTYCVWFTAGVAGVRNIIVYFDQVPMLILEMTDANHLSVQYGSSSFLVHADTMTTGTYYFVIVKYDASAQILYLKYRTESGNWNTTSVALASLSSRSNGMTLFHSAVGLQGAIDQFRYYSRALSEVEENILWNGGLGL